MNYANKQLLPVAIKPSGLNGSMASDSKLNGFLTSNCLHTLMVPEHEKLTVLRQLLSDDDLDDLHVETANLEQVYQHFLSKHEGSLHESGVQG